ncbi:hypothetical protein KPL70_001310 [Citrus sinensis]|nr:hypothetical protein KPL70_001310 [Citrus sinensis]
MGQEDQTQKCSNSSSGNCSGGGLGNIVRSAKKQKPKKVPQRGLGVAQLERIRIEEQKRKDASLTASSNQPCSSSISSPNSMFMPSSCSSVIQNIEILNSKANTVPSTNNPAGCSSSSVSIHHGHAANVHKLHNSCDYSLEKESAGVDPGLNFRSNFNNLPFDSVPVWPFPSSMQRPQLFLHPSSSMVFESSSATSSSSIINFQMEPPSNQSYYSNNYPPMWPEEDKMVGMKRPYPFSIDHPPAFSTLHYKIPPIVHPRVISRSEDSASCGRGHTLIFEPGFAMSREGSSCSAFMLEPNNSKKSIKENGVLNGGFLTLAPPTSTSLCQGSKFKRPPHFLAFTNSEFPDFELLPYQAFLLLLVWLVDESGKPGT